MEVRSGKKTIRPAAPLILLFACALWIGAALAFGNALQISTEVCKALTCVGLFCGLCLLFVAYRLPKARIVAVVVAGCLVGMSLGLCRAAVLCDSGNAAVQEASAVRRFDIVEDGRVGDFGSSCTARTTLEDGRTIDVCLRYPSDAGLVRYGQIVTAQAHFSQVGEASKSFFWQKGIVVATTVDSLEVLPRHDIIGMLSDFRIEAFGLFDPYTSQGAAFMRAILFGDRSGLEIEGFYGEVKTVGLAHIVAVSGAHLSIVCVLLAVLLKALRLPRRVIVVVQILFVCGYLICAGMPVSGIRAAIMTGVSLSAVFVRRRSSALSALAVCICAMVILTPEVSLSVSFILSAGATLGIVVFGSFFKEGLLSLFAGRGKAACEAFALTLSSSLITTPVALSVFSLLSLIAPFANLLAAPFFVFFCGGGLVVVFLVMAAVPLSSLLLDALVICAQAFCEGVSLLARVPFAAVPATADLGVALTIGIAFFALLWFWWPQPSARTLRVLASLFLVVFALVGVVFARPSGDEIIMLDVGQGDSFVIRSQGSTVLIDTGNQDTLLLAALARNQVYSLDAVFITHPDSDHCGSLETLGGAVSINTLCVANDLLTCACDDCAGLRKDAQRLVGDQGIVGLQVGDSVQVGAFNLEVIWPDTYKDEGGNSDSLCLILKSDCDENGATEWTGLFCGDAEQKQLAELIELKRLGDLDIYKVGHHGSKAALGVEEAEVLSPALALISAGEHNRYGHPASQTVEALEKIGCQVLRSDIAGDVVCRMTAESLSIDTLR